MPLSGERLEEWSRFNSIRTLEDWLLRKAGRVDWVSKQSTELYIRYIRELTRYSSYESPDVMLSAKTPLELQETISRLFLELTKKGSAPTSIIRRSSCLKRFFKVNHVEVNWEEITLPKNRLVVQDKAPNKLELRKILMFSPLWVKAGVLVLASSGIRISALIGLTIKDVDFEKYRDVAVITVSPELSKARVGYYTLVTPETKHVLEDYLKKRRGEEDLTGDSLLINPPISDKSTYSGFRQAYVRALQNAGLDKKSYGFHVLRIHALRKFFRTSLEGTMTRSQIERLMGHVSGEYLDGSYFRPPESDMVEAYRRAIPSLTVLEDVQSEEFQKKQLLRDASLILSSEKLKLLTELLARTTNIDEGIEEFRKLQEAPTNQTDHRLVESEDEMMKLLNQGWELDREINHGKFLMKK
jgi:integrase